MAQTVGPAPIFFTPIDNKMPKIYIGKLLFFPQTASHDDPTGMADALYNGMTHLLAAVPQLGGTLQGAAEVRECEAAAMIAKQKGTLCAAAPWHGSKDLFSIGDLRDRKDMDYAVMRQRHFPATHLDRAVFLPDSAQQNGVLDRPVFLVRVNFLRGGLAVALCVHHTFTDGNGTFTIARAFSAACKGEGEDVLRGIIDGKMMDRSRLMYGDGELDDIHGNHRHQVPPLEKLEQSSALDQGDAMTRILHSYPPLINSVRCLCNKIHTAIEYWWSTRLWSFTSFWIKDNAQSQKVPPNTRSGQKPRAELFFFSKAKLAELKDIAIRARSDRETNKNEWISTNDALCSLLRCCIKQANRPSHQDMLDENEEDSVLAIVVDGRRVFNPPIPAGAITNLLESIRVPGSPLSLTSTERSVADLALAIRRQLQTVDERTFRREIARLLAMPDLSRFVNKNKPGRPLITSWKGQDFYGLDWGPTVGRCERVRCCKGALRDLCVIMPELRGQSFEAEDMGLEVWLSLAEWQMENLLGDELFRRFATWRCA
ncbi:MAG: hypothetical protein L6R42_002067 [Xanthoria sp. 1 TBL-2021]|nr:MAG: hypothetical protein L6R42_002067 [Xanthoria sp. 1 TBL-2021]